MTENPSSEPVTLKADRYEDLERGPLVQLAIEAGIRGNQTNVEIITALRLKDAEKTEGDTTSTATEAAQSPPAPPEMSNDRRPASPNDPARPIAKADDRNAEPPEVLPVITDGKFYEFTSFIEKRFGAEGRAYSMRIKSMLRAVDEINRQRKEEARRLQKEAAVVENTD